MDRHRGKWKLYVPIGLSAWYFYGMLINSVRLGTRATFNQTVEPVGSIWMVNPFRNFIAVFTPTGIAVTLVGALLVCLITKKGYVWFSGYKFIRDKRGFDILPDCQRRCDFVVFRRTGYVEKWRVMVYSLCIIILAVFVRQA